MAMLRRATAAFVVLMLTHLVWVESGFACVMPAMDAPSAAVLESTSTAPMSDEGGCDQNAASSPTRSPSPEQPTCPFPWAPAGCHGMAPCAPPALAADTPASQRVWIAPVARLAGAELVPASVVRAPELPPPRA
jgi:hypothetical protein